MAEAPDENQLKHLQDEILEMVRKPAVDANLISKFNKYLTILINKKEFEGPLHEQTAPFVNNFSPTLILAILRTDGSIKGLGKPYQSILNLYVQLMVALIDRPEFATFVDHASDILVRSRHEFYRKTTSYSGFLMTENPSPYYTSNVKTFANSAVVETYCQYVEECKQLDMQHCLIVLRLFRHGQLNQSLAKEAIKSVVVCVSKKLASMIDGMTAEDLRVINEDEISSVVNCLLGMTRSTEIKMQLNTLLIRVQIALVKSSVLTQQFKAMEALRKRVEASYGYTGMVTTMLKEQGFVSFFLKDIHHALVKDFVVIFKEMLKSGAATDKDMKDFWVLTVNQHPGLIQYFMKGWAWLINHLTDRSNQVFRCIAETNIFPDDVLVFLDKNAFRTQTNERKLLFNAISPLYFDESGDNKRERQLIVNALKSLVPRDKDFLLQLQSECMSMIENGENLDYALPLFKASCQNVAPQKAHEYFDALLKTMSSNVFDVIQYSDLLVKIMEKLQNPLTEHEFSSIMKLLTPLMQMNLKEVCMFFKSVVERDTENGPLFRREFKSQILQAMSSLTSWTTEGYRFLIDMFKKLHATPITDGVECDDLNYLWSIVFSSSNCSYELADYLITIYSENPALFIRHCFEKIDSSGSLFVLWRLLRSIEDGLELEKIGIEPHVPIPEEKMRTVVISGDPSYTIRVPRDITFVGFCRRVSALLEKPISELKMKLNDQILTSSNFRLSDEETTITWKPYIPTYCYPKKTKTERDMVVSVESMDPAKIPSAILLDQEFAGPLFNLLSSKDPRIAARASLILDIIPTMPFEMEKFTDFSSSLPDWSELLNVDHPYLLLYRAKLISKLVKVQGLNWIQTFFASNGTTLLLRLVLSSEPYFETLGGPLLLLRVTKALMSIPEVATASKEIFLDEFEQSVPKIVAWVIKLTEKQACGDDDQFVLELLGLLEDFLREDWSFAKQNPLFVDLLKSVLFVSNSNVRKKMKIIVQILPAENHQDLILPLLPLALNKKCHEFFSLLKKVAESTEKTELLFREVVSVLFSHYKPPDMDAVSQLLFRPPSQNYTNGIFKVLNRLIKRMDSFPQSKELFEFLTHTIIFNTLKYYEPTKDLFEIVITLMERNKELSELIIPQVMAVNQSQNYLSVKFKAELTSTATARGLRNLGATCYMNATLQQLFNISELRNGILRTHFEEDDWLKEIQFIFAELSYFPCDWIDPRCFVSKWTDWGGDPINPREQQDAVEFLQMFLERLEAKLKGSTEIFQGQIAHTLIARNNEISPIDSTEDFLALPLEVKDHDNVEESLKTFLVPDRFEGSNQYKVEGVGLIDADRYHKIRKAPKILIAQLKRFEYDLQNHTRIKVNSHYTFPMVLDLAPVMENNTSVIYDLCGVVMHMGSALAGHYFSHVKRNDGKWLTFNDCSVKKCNGEQLPETAAGGRTTSRYDTATTFIDKDLNAYLLFYRMRAENATETCGQVSPATSLSLSELHESSNAGRDYESDENQTLHDGMDESVLTRLVESVRKAIITSVMTSPEFTKLIRYLTGFHKDGKFIYSFFINYLRTSCSSVATLASQCSDIFSTDHDFADFVLSQKDDFSEFFFSKDTDRRTLYCCLFIDALKYASPGAVGTIATNMKDGLETYVNNFESFDVLFRVLTTIVKAQTSQSPSVQQEWLTILTNFVTQVIPRFDSENKEKKLYLNVNLSAAFNLIRWLLENGSESDIATFGRILVDRSSDILCQWMLSTIHSYQVIELLRAVIEGSEDLNDEFLAIFTKGVEQKDLTPSQFAGLFVLSLRISDSMNKKRDETFINNFTKSKASYAAEVINDMANRAELFSGAMVKRFMDPEIIRPLVRACLFCREVSVRAALDKAICIFFKRPCDPPPVTDGDDTSLFKQLMEVLIDFLPHLEANLPRPGSVHDNSAVITGTYFKVLKWAIITGKLAPDACAYAKEFVGIFKKAFDVSIIRCVHDILDFLHAIVANGQSEQFFNKSKMFSKFISACNVRELLRGPTPAREILDLIPRSFVSEFVKSDCFREIAQRHFQNDECGTRLRSLIEDSLTNENVKSIMKELWDCGMFYMHTKPLAFQYVKMSWRILAKFPKSANLFYSNGLHDILWSDGIKTSLTRTDGRGRSNESMRPFAKLLGQFNISFVNENKDKKFVFKGKKVEWLAKHWREEGVNMEDLTAAALVAVPRGPGGANGICFLIKSLITMDIGFAKDFLSVLSKKKDGFVYRCPSDAQREAARLITTLNLQISEKTDQRAEADSLLVQEFASLSTQSVISFDVVNDICAQLLAIDGRMDDAQRQSIAESLDRIYSTTKNPKMMSSSISVLAQKLPNGNYENWIAHAVRLLSAEILSGLTQTETQLAVTGSNICTLRDFLIRLSGDKSLPIPKPTVRSSDVFDLATRFQQIEAINASDAATALTESLSLFDT